MKRHLPLLLILTLLCALLVALPVSAANEAGGTNNTEIPTQGATGNETDGNGDAGGGETPVAPSPSALTPQLIVSSYSYGGDAVLAGKGFTLNFTLKNTSRSLNIRNILVKVDGGEAFSLNKQSNTIYVEKIGPGGTSGQSVALLAPSTLADGDYPVIIAVSYEYYDNESKMSGAGEAKLSVPVSQDMRIQIKRVAPNAQEIYAYDTFNVAYSFVNTSFTQLLNTQVSVKDKASGEVLASAFVGTVEPSSESTSGSNLQLSFEEVGAKELEFVISYEDKRMNVKTVSQDLSVEVMEYVEPQWEEEGMGEEEPAGVSPILILVIVLVVVIGGTVAAVIIIRKRRARKLERELLEDEDEDL